MDSEAAKTFDIHCQKCPRLVDYLASVKRQYPEYHSAPVPAFGVDRPKVLIVGLAPGLHGANASGRPFTGDYAGILLYRMLYEFGFSTHPDSMTNDDGLELIGCRVTNTVKCLPPQNKPLGSEVNNCNDFLREEIKTLGGQGVILALGHLAHKGVLKSLALRQKDFEFAHHRVHNLVAEMILVDSYHCSRYNVNTKRLSAKMFREIFHTIVEFIE